jgi:hypothetical protein
MSYRSKLIFWIWISTCTNTICWKDHTSFTALTSCPMQKQVGYLCFSISILSLYSIDQYAFLSTKRFSLLQIGNIWYNQPHPFYFVHCSGLFCVFLIFCISIWFSFGKTGDQPPLCYIPDTSHGKQSLAAGN